MPMNVTKLVGKVRTCSVLYFDDSFAVTYRPSGITSETEDEDRELQEKGHKFVLADRLADMVVSWDLVDEKGDPIPVTQDFMRTLPSPVLTAMRSSIMEDMAPKSKSAGKSFAR